MTRNFCSAILMGAILSLASSVLLAEDSQPKQGFSLQKFLHSAGQTAGALLQTPPGEMMPFPPGLNPSAAGMQPAADYAVPEGIDPEVLNPFMEKLVVTSLSPVGAVRAQPQMSASPMTGINMPSPGMLNQGGIDPSMLPPGMQQLIASTPMNGGEIQIEQLGELDEATQEILKRQGIDLQALASSMEQLNASAPMNAGMPTNAGGAQLEHLKRIDQAAEEILKREGIDDKTFERYARLRCGYLLPKIAASGDSSALETRNKFREDLAKQNSRTKRNLAHTLTYYDAVDLFPQLSPQQQTKVIKETTRLIRVADDSFTTLLIPMQAAAKISQAVENDEKRGAATFRSFVVAAKTHDPKYTKDYLPKMEAVMTRLELKGKPIQVSGKNLKGEEFDIKNYSGKVVLVEFWATWCGPCREELPRIKELYAEYHDKGFEIVGISLDDDVQQLKAFIEQENIPWNIICDQQSSGATSQSIADKYGVSAIPTAILVNQQGRVCHLNARGKELEMHLQKMLGRNRRVSLNQ